MLHSLCTNKRSYFLIFWLLKTSCICGGVILSLNLIFYHVVYIWNTTSVHGYFMLLLASTPASAHRHECQLYMDYSAVSPQSFIEIQLHNAFIWLVSCPASFKRWPHTELLSQPHLCKCFCSQLVIKQLWHIWLKCLYSKTISSPKHKVSKLVYICIFILHV